MMYSVCPVTSVQPGMLITIAGGPSTEEVLKPSLDELMALALGLCVKGVLSATAGWVGGGKE